MKNIKLFKNFKNKVQRYLELKIHNQAHTKSFAIQASAVTISAWQQIVSPSTQIKNNNETLKQLPLLENLIENEECIYQLVSDIQRIRTYEKQLVEFMHQVVAENNTKSYQLYENI